MASRTPLVLGADGLPQQLQSADNLTLTGGTAPNATSANVALPSGYIFKAGQVTTSAAGVAVVTFPVAFPTACISLIGNPVPATANTTVYSVNIVGQPTKTGFTLQVNQIATALLVLTAAGGVALTVDWQAIGY